MDLGEEAIIDSHKQYPELRKLSGSKVSLVTVGDLEKGSLNLALTDEQKVSQIHLRMDQISVLDKIMFLKQASEVLYVDIMKESLDHHKSLQKISKLEAQLKWEKEANRDWKTKVK